MTSVPERQVWDCDSDDAVAAMSAWLGSAEAVNSAPNPDTWKSRDSVLSCTPVSTTSTLKPVDRIRLCILRLKRQPPLIRFQCGVNRC